jgi:hypothetical protein
MRRALFWLFAIGFAIAGLVSAPAIQAQSIAQRVADVRDGKVRMSFAARPGVRCDGSTISRRDSDEWESVCEDGPVRLVFELSQGEVVDLDVYVGGRWRPAASSTVDLGMVSAPRAAEFLLVMARQSPVRAGKQAIFAAVLADSAVVWPELLQIARDRSRPEDLRKGAVFWLGQAAGSAATAGLDKLAADETVDREIRETAVFALSQRPPDEAVAALIRIVRTHPDPAIRKKAVFWLGQTDDPRALQLFEELLAGS